MPAKKRMPRNTGIILLRGPMHGQGTKENVFSYIKAHPNKPSLLEKANRELKKTKIISRGLMTVAPLLGPKYGAIAGGAGMAAGLVGYGKPKRKRKAPAKKRKAPAKKLKAKK